LMPKRQRSVRHLSQLSRNFRNKSSETTSPQFEAMRGKAVTLVEPSRATDLSSLTVALS
jgi:hypothetical protein